jgi:hypothetical protein
MAEVETKKRSRAPKKEAADKTAKKPRKAAGKKKKAG